jgi:hypothetical protein
MAQLSETPPMMQCWRCMMRLWRRHFRHHAEADALCFVPGGARTELSDGIAGERDAWIESVAFGACVDSGDRHESKSILK